MRIQCVGLSSAVLLLGSTLVAQTPTGGPSPTPTPPPPPAPVYQSDPSLVNTYTSNNQRRPSVAVGIDGNYLIVWHSDAAEPGFYDIKGQLFTREGVKIGGEFQVDQGAAGHAMYTPSVASGGSGNYVVAWSDFLGNPSTDSEVWMRRFDGAANPLGAAVQVNTYTTARQRLPRVAANDTGQFVIVWGSDGQDGSGVGVFGQRYEANGTPSGAEFAVNTYTTGDQDRAAVNMDDSGFTVAFNDGNGVSAREFPSFALGEGSVQFPVFGANRRLPDVARLDGASSTFFVAENTSTGAIDGARSQNGTAGSTFTIISGTGGAKSNARVVAYAVPDPTLFPRFGDAPTDGPYNAGVVVCDRADVGFFEILGQLFQVDIVGIVEDHSPFPLSDPSGQQPVVAVDGFPGGAGYVVAGGSVTTSPVADTVDAGDGSGFGVEQVRFGSPDARHGFSPNGAATFVAGTPATFGTSPTNLGPDPLPLTGTLSQFSLSDIADAPESATITDATASYGTIAPGAVGDCQAQGDCYGITVNGPRPNAHWDETVTETLSTGVHKKWRLHVGGSFADVPDTNLFYAFIENLLHNGVTAGGACGGYCPADGVKRQQMAVFLLKSRFGAAFVPPPATGTIFTDVPLSNPFASWIEALFLLGVTGGCSGGPPPAPTQFCPDAIVNRQQMAVFLLKTLEGSQYLPPAAVGLFADVTPGGPFEKWIEELYNRQVTGGCATSPLRYCPANPTNRQQMAAFLVKTFSLLLYGP